MATNSESRETPEYRIFREHYDLLVTAISDPLPLATRLFAKSIIDSTLLQRVNLPTLPPFQNTNTLLTAVLGRIETDPSAFGVFMSALKEDSSLKLLVESMQRGNLSTTSGAHGRDGGEEQCTHAQEENTLFLASHLDNLSVCGESATLPRHVPYQHHHPSSPQVFHLPPCDYQPPVRQHIYQSPYYPPPLGQYSYQTTESARLSYYQPFNHQSPTQHSHPPTSETSYKQHHYHPQTVQLLHYPYSDVHFPIHPRYLLPDTPLRKYALFLRACYTEHEFTSTKWPHLDAGKYINLAVISNVYTNRRELERFRQQIIHGCIDDILEWKAPIEMKDILKPNCIRKYDFIKDEAEIIEFPVTQLLIEGAPGVGKSTFAWEVCQRWGQHQLFNEFSLVVLLKFRDKRVQEAKNMSDLFYHPHPKLQSEIADQIVLSGGRGLLLILERFDEAPASKRTMNSIFVRLFKGQELPKATVILTTRPSASGELRELCKGKHSRRIEILGFGKKEIDEYIHCVFSDEQSQSDFKEYLSLYPHIHSMMYVPLNSAIVTHVYESCKSSGVIVPKTMTQLYSSLTRTLLLRDLKDKEEYNDTCTNINSFKDLPQPIYDQFCAMCKIAHEGIMCHMPELIFQDLPSNFEPLGLMQTCPELYVDKGASVSYNFLHLTIQEYLAACYISQQSRDKQVAFMREHIESKKLEVVMRFLAGVSELGRELWDVVREFASMAKPSDSLLQGETNFIKLKILHCLFESQDPSAITSVLGSDCVCYNHDCRSALPFDWYVLAYCITHSSCDWKLELKYCEMESIEVFLRALNLQQDQCQLPSTGQTKEVWLKECHPAAVDLLVANMSRMLVFYNLTHFALMKCNFRPETCNLLSKCTDILHHLEYLNLGGNRNIARGGAANLITSLNKHSTIRELHLDYTGIGFEDCEALNELLASSSYLKVLCISENALSVDSVHLILDGLSYNVSLEKLNMHYSNFSSDNVLHLASILKVNTTLKVLNISQGGIQSRDAVHLAKALEGNDTTRLQTLSLSDNPIGSDGTSAFAAMLAINKSLTKLNIRCCSIQGEGAVCLAKAIMEENTTLREFDISYNAIGSVGTVGFASMLKRNHCLKILKLCDNSVGVEGTLKLIDSLRHNTTLEKLVLSQTCKPPSFHCTLDKALEDRVTFRQW